MHGPGEISILPSSQTTSLTVIPQHPTSPSLFSGRFVPIRRELLLHLRARGAFSCVCVRVCWPGVVLRPVSNLNRAKQSRALEINPVAARRAASRPPAGLRRPSAVDDVAPVLDATQHRSMPVPGLGRPANTYINAIYNGVSITQNIWKRICTYWVSRAAYRVAAQYSGGGRPPAHAPPVPTNPPLALVHLTSEIIILFQRAQNNKQ